MQIEEFLKEKNIKLNSQQMNAVQSINGKTLLLAVPGSGKTTVIVSRIGYMIYAKNINPRNILTLTYSVSAAKDMKHRYEIVFGKEENLNFRTIHSFCVMVLKEFEKQTGRKIFEIINNMNQILAKIYLQIKHSHANDIIIGEIINQITYCKNNMISIEDIKKIKNSNINFYEVYNAYEKYKIQNKFMDFDDQLQYAYYILKNYPNILSKFKDMFIYVNVDEAQDTSKLQHEIIKLLVRRKSFYGWG